MAFGYLTPIRRGPLSGGSYGGGTLVDGVRRDAQLAGDFLGGLVLDQEVEHFPLLLGQPSQHEFNLGVLAAHLIPALCEFRPSRAPCAR